VFVLTTIKDRSVVAAERHEAGYDNCAEFVPTRSSRNFFCDKPDDARGHVQMGIDVILANCAHVLIDDGILRCDTGNADPG